eukprot:TRINITY_DN5983_c0_g1_i6.p1 TRINITY_DN5983_c0_g1~~TRINITY_DN5983_c0_g1_i6.p1  ORF type:complete len:1872 (+),score=340.11 TRINITY_DN5983_c0_g1_i6:125-5740(+)
MHPASLAALKDQKKINRSDDVKGEPLPSEGKGTAPKSISKWAPVKTSTAASSTTTTSGSTSTHARPTTVLGALKPAGSSVRSPAKPRETKKEVLSDSQLETKLKEMQGRTQDKTQAKRISRNKDTIATLLDSLNTKPKFTKMVEYSVECLKNLAVDEASVDEMIEEGVLETLMKVMKLNPYNEKIQRMINTTLEAFAMNDRLAGIIAQRLGPGAFVFSMKKHVEPETLATTTGVVAKLLKYENKDTLDSFVKEGLVGAIKSVVSNPQATEVVLAGGVECLDRVASGPKEYAKQVFESGVVENVLDALAKHPHNAKLVESAVSLIGKLGKSDPKILEQLKKMGAVDILVAALEMHPDNERILELGAIALQTLAGEDDLGMALKVTVGNNLATAKAISKISSLMLVAENVDFMARNEGVAWLLSALKGAVGAEGDVARNILLGGTRALMRMATDENKIYEIMRQGGVKLLISVLSAHAGDEDVATSALQALTKMITRKENGVFILKSGGVEAALAVLQKHPDSEKAAKIVLDFWQKIAAHPDLVPSLVEKGVIQQIVETLQRHGQNPEIAMAAVNCLGRMAVSEEYMGKIAAAGGLEALVRVLGDHADNLELAKQCMLMIESAAMMPINVEPLRKAGAMDSLLKAIEAHPEEGELQEIGSRTLAMIAGKDQLKAAVGHVAELATRMGATPSLATTHADKLTAAVKLLGNLALVESNIDYLVKNGAVESLISAFQAGVKLPIGDKRAKLLASAAQGLARLATNKEAAQAIVKKGALKDVMQAAISDPENEELAEYATKLAAVCAADPANVDQMIADGAIEDIIALAKAHPLNEKILAAATKALGLLAKDEAAIKRIIAAGGAEVVVESIFANMDNPEALLNALQVLSQLAIDEEAIQALVDAGAIDAILEAMRKHPDNAEILKACMSALCSLMISEEIASSVGEKGGIPLMIKAMRDHYGDEALCEVDMVLCDSLASVRANAEKFLATDLGTIELVKWIAGKYAENTVIEEAAAKLLATLMGPPKEEKKVEMTVENVVLNEAKADSLLDAMKNTDLDSAAKQSMLSDLTRIMQDPANAKLMVQKGGLQALAAMMKENADDEGVFYNAASAFLTLAEHAGDEAAAYLEDPACLEALCMMMKSSENFATPMNLADLARAVGFFAKMKLKPGTVKQMLKTSPLSALMKIICQSDDPLLLISAAKLLGKLSNNEEAHELLSQIASIRELINAMRRNIKNEEFLQYGVYLLGNLAQNEKLKGEIGIEGGIQLILQIMEMYNTNKSLVENCCFALANLSFQNAVNCSFIVACRGIQILIAMMGTHTKAEELLESAVCVLCNLCHGNDANKDEIIKRGGAQAIVDTVLGNFDALELLTTSFRTLGNLAYNKANITAIIKAGGVQGIVAGMTVHSEQLEVIDVAIRVITNLAADPDEENMGIMAQEGAVQAVVEAAIQFVKHPDLESAALGCLCNLGRAKYNAQMIIKQGGSEAVCDSFKETSYEAKVTDKGSKLIHILTMSQMDLDRILDAKATEALVGAVKAHAKNKPVLSSALNAIASLAFGEKAALRMQEQADPIHVILDILKANMSDPGIVTECFKALSSLSRAEDNGKLMADTMWKLIPDVFKTHTTNPKVLEAVFKFLSNICIHRSCTASIPSTALVPTCLTVFQAHPKDPVVLMRGCKALENMACSPGLVKEHMKREGVLQGMKQIQTDNVGRDDIRNSAQAVIDVLSKVDMDISLTFTGLAPLMDRQKNAKMIFGKEEKAPVKNLPRDIRNMLTAGALLTKHSKTAKPRPRYVYIDQDLKFIVWKDPKEKVLDPKNKMKVFQIKQIERGRTTEQLKRKNAFGKFLSKEECSFAIIGRERTIDLEAPSEAEREK